MQSTPEEPFKGEMIDDPQEVPPDVVVGGVEVNELDNGQLQLKFDYPIDELTMPPIVARKLMRSMKKVIKSIESK